MKFLIFYLFLFSVLSINAQQSAYKQQKFCSNLHKVFELGRKDNFNSYDGTLVKQSPMLPVPGYAIKLDEFAINYADKDNRFIAKTNLNLDSVSAHLKLEELKNYVGGCLDSIEWKKWQEVSGDDSTTVFIKEIIQSRAVCKDLVLNIAITCVAPKIYSIALYVKRR